VWLTYDEGEPVGVWIICFAISTSIGGMVAKLDDVFVIGSKRRRQPAHRSEDSCTNHAKSKHHRDPPNYLYSLASPLDNRLN
jgi:hypothetical protein